MSEELKKWAKKFLALAEEAGGDLETRIVDTQAPWGMGYQAKLYAYALPIRAEKNKGLWIEKYREGKVVHRRISLEELGKANFQLPKERK